MPQNFHLVSLKILEFYRRKIFNQWVYAERFGTKSAQIRWAGRINGVYLR